MHAVSSRVHTTSWNNVTINSVSDTVQDQTESETQVFQPSGSESHLE